MAQAVVAQIGARGRVVGAEALPAIALVSARGVARSRRSGVARSRRIGIGGAGTVAVSGTVAIAGAVAIAGRVAVAGVVGVGGAAVDVVGRVARQEEGGGDAGAPARGGGAATAPPTLAPATAPGAQPRQPRRHCTASTWGAAAFLSDVGAVIGAAPAGAANGPAARAAAARSLQGIFITLYLHSLTLLTDGAAAASRCDAVGQPRLRRGVPRFLGMRFRCGVHIRV